MLYLYIFVDEKFTFCDTIFCFIFIFLTNAQVNLSTQSKQVAFQGFLFLNKLPKYLIGHLH